jgi:hypothetical protein
MNKMMRFYAMMFSYLQAGFEDSHTLKQIVSLAGKAKPSWKTSIETVKFLEQCCNRGETVQDDDVVLTTQNDFIKAAFRDLSPIKNREAMDLFTKLAEEVSATYREGDDMLVLGRTIRERHDGSAVIVLHVTDLARFRASIENHTHMDPSTEENSLEAGVLIGS